MSSNLTAHDIKILAAGFQCFEPQPKVDYEKLMGIMGWTTKNSAKTTWYQTRRKVMNFSLDGDAELTLPGKGRGRKRKAAEDEDDERRDSASPGPKKSGKKSKIDLLVAGGDDGGSDDERTMGSFIPPRPIKRARKSREEVTPQTGVKQSVELGSFSDDGLSEDETMTKAGEEIKGLGTDHVDVKGEGADEDLDDDFLKELNAFASSSIE